ncbi:type II toxin-antitoxin system RelE/ParE family toxin [Cronobacter sakazakii]|nr:type II toxin-antitoxin system RelE/ParE family toxin [Cronobacter sakazakii]EGT4280990.1 type II toxin-antitoxin system RelE/ParE family toxin [Cronobacter malonaticus]EGT4298866.1 type II toxin-antitoxin system RelE/ParE family toxin [Cronobacter malonaticus]EIZ2460194.1 type II toxin-antitoxin system RelE/ParE family toxin [Cronobacter sakazakii]EJO9549742.1 type II toxin-antitoxin system RelE/ParE family toxin [Cronobacter sakazakii]EJT7706342.1 type II toxin-antitoxin system RelE/ParE 
MNVEQNGSELENEIEVFQTRRFEKALDKLPESLRAEVEDEVDRIIQEPEIGELKKGDLSFLRVHKFRLNNQLMLLGYCWVENKLELYMLSIGSHENFYQEQKQHRKADLKLIS